jgi:hypothetical protein
MNTLTLNDKESYSKLINNTWKFVCYFNTRDGLNFNEKKKIKIDGYNETVKLYFESDSLMILAHYLGYKLPIKLDNNLFNIDKLNSKLYLDLLPIYYDNEVEKADEFFEDFKHSTCFKLENNYLYIYSDKLNKGYKLEKE